jgi:hypothetical protein
MAAAKKAQGFEPVRQFAHKAKHRRGASSDQKEALTPWDALMAAKRGRIDFDRVNWPGCIYLQQECGLFDPKPRLIKKVHNG